MRHLRNWVPFVAPAAVMFGALFLMGAGDPPGSAPTRVFKPVQSIERLMHGQDKLYDEIKEAIMDHAWKPAETSAWLLAEMANVNQYQSGPKAGEPRYQELAARMSSECVELAKLLKKRDEAAAKAQFSQVSRTCKACHDAYNVKE